MQKKLIALAIAGLSTAAFAQSNVTISGQMRVNVDSVRASGATAGSAGDYTSRTRVTDNNSNIRFAGEEALGNGMSAWFQIESAIGTDNNTGTTGANSGATGNTSTGIGTRNTAVGLKGNWGSFLIGKWDVHYHTMAAIEAAGLADGLAVGSNSITLLNSLNGQLAIGTRFGNVIAYNTPNFNGFDATIGYQTGNESTNPGMPKKDNAWTFNPRYNNGPIAVAYSYLAINNTAATPALGAVNICVSQTTGAISTAANGGACGVGTSQVGVAPAVAASNGINIRSNKLGAAYTFPMGFKIGLIWDKSKATLDATGDGNERSAWSLPMSYRTGAHNITATYAKANKLSLIGAGLLTGAAAGADASAAKMWTLGYEYAMSKRTSVGVTYVQVNNDANARADFWHPSSNVAASSNGGLAAGSAGADPRMFSVGLTHKF